MDDPLSCIRITRNAMGKAQYISRRITEMTGLDLEVAFYLLNSKDAYESGDIAVREIMLPHAQVVRDSKYTIPGNALIIDKHNFGKEWVMHGYGHSHGGMDAFHSGPDDDSLRMNLKSGGLNYVTTTEAELFEGEWEDGRAVFSIGGRSYVLDFELMDLFKHDALNSRKIILAERRPEEVEFLYGMVFNNKGSDPFGVIGIKRDGEITLEGRVGIKVIGEESEFDTEAIDARMLSSIKCGSRPLSDYVARKGCICSLPDKYDHEQQHAYNKDLIGLHERWAEGKIEEVGPVQERLDDDREELRKRLYALNSGMKSLLPSRRDREESEFIQRSINAIDGLIEELEARGGE